MRLGYLKIFLLLNVGVFLICPYPLYADYFNEKLLDALEKKVVPKAPSREVYKQKIDIGEYYFQKRMYVQAKEIFWQAIDLFPDNPEGYVNLATVHIKEGNYDGARRILEQADQIAKKDYYQREVIFYNLGICFYMDKKYSDAAQYLSKAISLYPDFGEAMYYLGLCNDKQGKREFAFLNVFNAKYIFEKKGKLKLVRQTDKFLKNLKDNLPMNKKALAQGLYEAAKNSLESKDLERAYAQLEESIALDPSYIEAYYELALLYSRKRAFYNSIAYLHRIIEVDEKPVKAFINLGYVYKELKRYDKAILSFETALDIGGETAEIFYDIAMVYLEQGKISAARKSLGKAKRIAVDNKELTLIGKIKKAQFLVKKVNASDNAPAKAYRRFKRKLVTRSSYPHHRVSGNGGSFNDGYFVPLPKEEAKYKKTKISVTQY